MQKENKLSVPERRRELNDVRYFAMRAKGEKNNFLGNRAERNFSPSIINHLKKSRIMEISEKFIHHLAACLVFSEREFTNYFLHGYDSIKDFVKTDIESFTDSVMCKAIDYLPDVNEIEYFLEMCKTASKERL